MKSTIQNKTGTTSFIRIAIYLGLYITTLAAIWIMVVGSLLQMTAQ